MAIEADDTVSESGFGGWVFSKTPITIMQQHIHKAPPTSGIFLPSFSMPMIRKIPVVATLT